jgi:hypothetical protein
MQNYILSKIFQRYYFGLSQIIVQIRKVDWIHEARDRVYALFNMATKFRVSYIKSEEC